MSDSLNEYEESIVNLIINDFNNWNYLVDSLKNNKDFILKLIKKDQSVGFIYSNLNEILKADKEIALESIKNSIYSLDYIPKNLKEDKGFILEIIKNKDVHITKNEVKLFNKYKNDKDVVLELIKKQEYTFLLLNDFKMDRDFILQAVKNNGLVLKFCNQYKNDAVIVMEAVKQNIWSLSDASNELKSNLDFAYKLCDNDINGFFDYLSEQITNNFKNEKEFKLNYFNNKLLSKIDNENNINKIKKI